MIDIDLSSLGPKAAIAGTILMSLFLGGSSAVKILTQKPIQAELPNVSPTLTPEGLPTPTSEIPTSNGSNGAKEEIVYKYEYEDAPAGSNNQLTTSQSFSTTASFAPTAVVVRQAPTNAPIVPTNTRTPTSVPPTTAPTAVPQNGSQCMVTLFGVSYDITNLVNTHSGGNIFHCGTDMTTTYQGKHGTSVSRMTPYLPGGSGTTSGSGGSSGGTQYNCSGKDDGWSEAQKKYCEKLKEQNHDDD